MKLIACSGMGAMAVALATPAAAQSSQTSAAVDVLVGGGVATNPYSEVGSPSTAINGTLEVRPQVQIRDPSTVYRLGGALRHVEFLSKYRSNDSVDLTADVSHQASDRLELHGGAGFSWGDVNSFNMVSPANPVNPTDPVTDPVVPPIIDDVALNGLDITRTSYRATVGGSYRPSAYDRISLDVGASNNYYSKNANLLQLDEFGYWNADLGYARAISETTEIGAMLSYGRVNYFDQTLGDGTIITPMAIISHRLSETLSIKAGAGVTRSRIQELTGVRTRTSWAANLSGCYRDSLSHLCLTGTRRAMPSSLAGVRTQTGLTVDYARRLSEMDDIAVSGSYARSSGGAAAIVNGVPVQYSDAISYASIAGTFNHRFAENLFGFITAGYSDTFGAGIARRPNLQLSAGVRIRFGRIQ